MHTTEMNGKIVSKLFFLSSTTRTYFKELLLPLHSLPPFPKHDKQTKEPSEGWCRLGYPLSFYLPSPQTPPFFALPRLLDSSLPLTTTHCFGQSLRAVTWEGFEPVCRYCSSFHFSIMSLVADVHMCCPCVYPERWFCYLFIFLL